MIVCTAGFKPKGFGIKKYVRFLNTDIAAVSNIKLSKRKQRKLEKYIISLSREKLLNNSHLEIFSYGCFSECHIISQLCEMMFEKTTDLSLNDADGYAVNAIEKYIRKFSSVRIYGAGIYRDIQERLYRENGVCIILANERIKNATDTENILETVRNVAYINNIVSVSYLDMLRHYGTKWEGTPEVISLITQSKNP